MRHNSAMMKRVETYLLTHRAAAFLCCLLTSALILMFCTKSSFLYPLNDWEDANIIYTLGRGMLRGRVPFLDLYDQKGPLAYFVYGLGSLVSPRSFFGLYLIETLCFAGFLYNSGRILKLYGCKHGVFCVPLLGALVASAMSFTHGGSLEELSLPLLSFSLYESLRYYKTSYPAPMPFWRVLLHGFFAGCLLWMKYTMLGFYLAWMAVLFFALLAAKRTGRAFACCGVFLSGMALSSLPWLLYFYWNQALPELFRFYFINNIFGYGDGASRGLLRVLLDIGQDTLATFYRNAQYSVLIALGVLYQTFSREPGKKPVETWNLWALCVTTCAFIYIGGQGYRYYGLVLSVFAPLGLVPLLRLFSEKLEPRLSGRRILGALPALLLAVSLALCPLLSDNTYLLGAKKEALPQYRFAAIMRERARQSPITLVCYQMMDSGFYLTAGYEPEFRYYTRLNVAGDEIRAAQDGYVRDGIAEFLVTQESGYAPEGYELLAESSYWYEEHRPIYYLYQRVG